MTYKKLVFYASIPAVLILILVDFFSGRTLEEKHNLEINYIISSHQGKVTNIIQTSLNSPFNSEIDKFNTVYKVEYIKSEKKYIAWYRALNSVYDIHDKPNSAFEEKWVFEE